MMEGNKNFFRNQQSSAKEEHQPPRFIQSNPRLKEEPAATSSHSIKKKIRNESQELHIDDYISKQGNTTGNDQMFRMQFQRQSVTTS